VFRQIGDLNTAQSRLPCRHATRKYVPGKAGNERFVWKLLLYIFGARDAVRFCCLDLYVDQKSCLLKSSFFLVVYACRISFPCCPLLAAQPQAIYRHACLNSSPSFVFHVSLRCVGVRPRAVSFLPVVACHAFDSLEKQALKPWGQHTSYY
jgi:hypothetical protein